MKKLNLLKPEVYTGYLEGRGREQVKYALVRNSLGMEAFLEDIKSGAPFFENLKAQAERKPSKTVVIRTDNEEVGMMAVTYLAAIYNEIDGKLADDDPDEAELSNCALEDYFEDEGIDLEGDDDVDAEPQAWIESPHRLPMIDSSEIEHFLGGGSYNVFGDGVFGMQGEGNARQRDPWWAKCKSEPVCIMKTIEGFGFGDAIYQDFSTKVGNYFRNNRHIYVLDVSHADYLRDPIDYGMGEDGYENPDFTRMVLETAAAVIDIKGKWDKDKVMDYRITQFENWVEEEGFTLEEDFSANKIVSRIDKMKNENKSELMHQVIHYIKEQGDGDKVLKEGDFDILRRFANLTDKKERESRSSKKLEGQLYGMEDVKRQVRETVDVLKYYKRREAIGLNKGGFHNVHLLIGAPGTAKTTVAKLMGNMMREMNLLPGNRFTCMNGADLKGMYVGHTAPKVKQLFEEYDIIMIDEAYSLVATDGCDTGADTFSQEAVAALITGIEEYGTEKLILFAGYGGVDVEEKDNLMKRFIDSNPGLKSRINSTIYFKSYDPEQMVEIVHIQAKTQQFTLTKKADEYILEYFKERIKDRNFGNGREARSLLQNATIFAAQRTRDLKPVSSAKRKFQEITVSDIRNAIERQRLSTAMQNGRACVGRLGFN